MGVFELNDYKTNRNKIDEVFTNDISSCKNLCREENKCKIDTRRIKEENIIALKIYDSCRQQDCLLPEELGPCRAAECVMIGDCTINEGDIIIPPIEAASVTIDRLKVKKVLIVEKEPSCFRKGYWDIDLKYIFEYRLIFREADGCIIGSIKTNSIFNKKLSLFGSEGCDLVISTDLFNCCNDSSSLDAEPFILVESKAIGLSAELKYTNLRTKYCTPTCSEEIKAYTSSIIGGTPIEVPTEVNVSIGLFSIIKLFRIVDLSVESKGFTIPRECDSSSPLNPCSYFDNLDFPMDLFAPPQKPEFMAGISSNIPRKYKHKNGCHNPCKPII